MKSFQQRVREAAEKHIRGWKDINGEAYEAYLDGANFAASLFVEYLKEYREAYPEDIFQPIKENEKNLSSDRVSAQMARFLLDNCIKYWTVSGKATVEQKENEK